MIKGCVGLGACQVALMLFLSTPFGIRALAQGPAPEPRSPQSSVAPESQTTKDYNQRLQQLFQVAGPSNPFLSAENYRIGTEDLLDVSVYGAPDLSGEDRVAADGSISLPLVGTVQAAGLTARELGSVLQELLRRTYMKDPHVSVFVKEMESHSVSVFGAVARPGVFQIRSTKSLIEVLSMAQGLTSDAGDTVIIMRHGDTTTPSAVHDPAPAAASDPPANRANENASNKSVEINLKDLIDTGDSRYNVVVYPGDVVTVTRAGVVYVIGDVNKPGGYLLKTNENISVLQALALAEGETHTASGKHARIIRTDKGTGARTEIPINLNKILAGNAADPVLHAKDIVFVPNSAGKAALYRSTEGILSTVGGAAIYRW